MLCVVCFRDLPDVTELVGVRSVTCACGARYGSVMIHEFHTNPQMRASWKAILRREGWRVQYNRETGEVVVTNG